MENKNDRPRKYMIMRWMVTEGTENVQIDCDSQGFNDFEMIGLLETEKQRLLSLVKGNYSKQLIIQEEPKKE